MLCLPRAYLRCTGGEPGRPCPAKKLVDIDQTAPDGAPRVHYLNAHTHLPPDPVHAHWAQKVTVLAEPPESEGSPGARAGHARTALLGSPLEGPLADADARVQPGTGSPGGAQPGTQPGIQPGMGSSPGPERQGLTVRARLGPSWRAEPARAEGGDASAWGAPGVHEGWLAPRPPELGSPQAAPGPEAVPRRAPGVPQWQGGGPQERPALAPRVTGGGSAGSPGHAGHIRWSPGEGAPGRGAEPWGGPPALRESRGRAALGTAPLGESPGYTGGASPWYTGESRGGLEGRSVTQGWAPPSSVESWGGAPGATARSPREASAEWSTLHGDMQNTSQSTVQPALQRTTASTLQGTVQDTVQGIVHDTVQGIVQDVLQHTTRGTVQGPTEVRTSLYGGDRGGAAQWAGQGLRGTGWHGERQPGRSAQGLRTPPASWQAEEPRGVGVLEDSLFEDPLQFLGGRDTLRPSHLLDPPVTTHAPGTSHPPVTSHSPATTHAPGTSDPPVMRRAGAKWHPPPHER